MWWVVVLQVSALWALSTRVPGTRSRVLAWVALNVPVLVLLLDLTTRIRPEFLLSRMPYAWVELLGELPTLWVVVVPLLVLGTTLRAWLASACFVVAFGLHLAWLWEGRGASEGIVLGELLAGFGLPVAASKTFFVEGTTLFRCAAWGLCAASVAVPPLANRQRLGGMVVVLIGIWAFDGGSVSRIPWWLAGFPLALNLWLLRRYLTETSLVVGSVVVVGLVGGALLGQAVESWAWAVGWSWSAVGVALAHAVRCGSVSGETRWRSRLVGAMAVLVLLQGLTAFPTASFDYSNQAELDLVNALWMIRGLGALAVTLCATRAWEEWHQQPSDPPLLFETA